MTLLILAGPAQVPKSILPSILEAKQDLELLRRMTSFDHTLVLHCVFIYLYLHLSLSLSPSCALKIAVHLNFITTFQWWMGWENKLSRVSSADSFSPSLRMISMAHCEHSLDRTKGVLPFLPRSKISKSTKRRRAYLPICFLMGQDWCNPSSHLTPPRRSARRFCAGKLELVSYRWLLAWLQAYKPCRRPHRT